MRPRPSRASISCACGSSAARASPSPGRRRASEYPLALAGVATVIVLFQAVRRSFGPVAGLIAAVVMALTPVAVLMFRFNNPDALLTLLLVSAAWAVVRGLEDGRFRWAILASALVGLAFLTKYLQAYLVLPPFALVWLVAAHGSLRRRVARLAIAGMTTP